MSRRILSVSITVGVVTTAALLSRSRDGSPSVPTAIGAVRAFGPLHPRLAPAGDRVVFSYQGAIWVIRAELIQNGQVIRTCQFPDKGRRMWPGSKKCHSSVVAGWPYV